MARVSIRRRFAVALVVSCAVAASIAAPAAASTPAAVGIPAHRTPPRPTQPRPTRATASSPWQVRQSNLVARTAKPVKGRPPKLGASPAPNPPPDGPQCISGAMNPPAAKANQVVISTPRTSDYDHTLILPALGTYNWFILTQGCPSIISNVLGIVDGVDVGSGAALVSLTPVDQSDPSSGTLVSLWGAAHHAQGGGNISGQLIESANTLFGYLAVIDQQTMFATFASCRGCNLGNIAIDGADAPINPSWPLSVGDDTWDASKTGYLFAHDLSGANLSGASLTGDFTGWNLAGANLTGAHLDGVTFGPGTKLTGADFTGASFNNVKFIGVDLSGATVTPAGVTGNLSMTGITIGTANNTCTQLGGMDLVRNPFSITTVASDCSTRALFPRSTVPLDAVPAAHWGKQNMSDAYFVVQPGNASFLKGATLGAVPLNGTVLMGAPANLTGTNLDSAQMNGASFELANFTGGSMRGVHAANASFNGATFAPASGSGTFNFGPLDSAHPSDLSGASFTNATLTNPSFANANLSNAVLSYARITNGSFLAASLTGAQFDHAHLVNGGSGSTWFHQAVSLTRTKFTDAVILGGPTASNLLAFTNVDISNASFAGAQCIDCDFTGTTLTGTDFGGSYLVGSTFTGGSFTSTSFLNAWLYCGARDNSHCPAGSNNTPQWTPKLGSTELAVPVTLAPTNLTGTVIGAGNQCPDGTNPTTSQTDTCTGHDLPQSGRGPVLPPACAPAGLSSCVQPVSTVLGGSSGPALMFPYGVTPGAAPFWSATGGDQATTIVSDADNHVIRLVDGSGDVGILAGSTTETCPAATGQGCGDGGSPSGGRFGRPTGLAVGPDGSIYVADYVANKVRKITWSGRAYTTISTIAGTGASCGSNGGCGNGAAATHATLTAPTGVWVDPLGDVYIASWNGVQVVSASDGIIRSVAASRVESVTGDALGNLYLARLADDTVSQITVSGKEQTVVGVSGQPAFNGSTGSGATVHLNDPTGLTTDLAGNLYISDRGNGLIREWFPTNGQTHTIGGVVTDNLPVPGFNGDGLWAYQTEFIYPNQIAITKFGQFLVADGGQNRVRLFGPAPPPTGPSR